MTAALPDIYAETAGAVPVLRPAAPHQKRAVRLLLPELHRTGLPWQATVATAGDNGPIIGAAAVVTGLPHRVEGRCPAEVHVIRPWLGRGLERSLWDAVLTEARSVNAGVVCQGWSDVAQPAPVGSVGFAPVKRRYEFKVEVPPNIEKMIAMGRRLEQHGRVPAGARALSLGQANVDAVAALHLRYFPGTADELRAAFRGRPPECFDLDLSVVTVIDGQVTAYVAGQFLSEESVFDIHWKAVAEPFRNSWSNLWLMYHVGLRMHRRGVQWLRYRALTHNRDTRLLIEHIGGAMTREQVRYGRD